MRYRIKVKDIVEVLKCNAICATLFFTTFNTFVFSILSLIEINAEYSTEVVALFSYGILFIMGLYSVFYLKPFMLIFPLFMLIMYFASFIFFPENRPFLLGNEILLGFLGLGLPAFLSSVTLDNIEKLEKYLHKYCITVVFIQTFLSIAAHLSMPWCDRSNYMEISYQLLVPIIYFLLLEKGTIIDKFCLIAGIIIIIIDGARGPLVGIILCIAYRIISRFSKEKIALSIFFGMLGIIILIANYQMIFTWILNTANHFGFKGNLIRHIEWGDVFSPSGRDELFSLAVTVINKFMFTGSGMAGDRYWLNALGYGKTGAYTHNIFGELLIDYGIILGAIIILFLCIMIYLCFIKRESMYLKIFKIFFFSLGFSRLLLSSSYIIEVGFYVMMAMMMRGLKFKYIGDKDEEHINNCTLVLSDQ